MKSTQSKLLQYKDDTHCEAPVFHSSFSDISVNMKWVDNE